MARYSTRKKYGYRGKRGYASSGRRRSYSKMARRATRKPRFATVGYTRDAERKYSDNTFVSVTWLPQVVSYEASQGQPASLVTQGIKYMSQVRPASGLSNSQNLVANLAQSTTATGRIGNKVNGKWLNVGITVEAAKSPLNQGGEQVNAKGGSGATPAYYMKTNFRLVLVKDLQVNNSINKVDWADVFGTGSSGTDGTSFGANDKLDIQNMGRFRIMSDRRVTVDGTDPLKNIQMGCAPGKIRYNGGAVGALTDKGYYLLVAQDVTGDADTIATVLPGTMRFTSRLTFTDE